jgi:hypothetical protein
MAMRSTTSPRRIYLRAGSPLVCFGGVYFGPMGTKASTIDHNNEVRLEILSPSTKTGKKRVKVTQKVGRQEPIVETWIEKNVVFQKRSEEADETEAEAPKAKAPRKSKKDAAAA